MAIALTTAMRSAIVQVLLDAIDADVGAGTLELLAADGTTVLAILTLADPAGSVTNGVLTIDTTPELATTGETAAGAGTAATLARYKDNSGDIVISGMTVGTSGTNIVMTSNTIVSTEPVTITAFTITAPHA